ncbi:MBL fold metallo-hydrolase [Candidatus Pacearchaeota archaeon]|nr:MBL fold metallo-hydrolase [Candidatus Pacearchaeota archaeon]
MIQKIKPNIWQIGFKTFSTYVYLLKLDEKNILIDTGSRSAREELVESLNKLKLKPGYIDIILMTHNHWDHTENLDLFKKAKVYGHKKGFPNDKTIIDIDKLKIKEIKVIKTPGHSPGDICFYMPEEKILFSGDVLFHKGYIGRTDFPSSLPEKMQESLEKLKELDYDILLPGHGVE